MRILNSKFYLNIFFTIALVILALFGCSRSGPEKGSVLDSKQPPKAAPVFEDRDDRPVILAFGDSLTAGRGVDPDRNYPSKLQAKIDAHGYRYRVVNAGVSGETSSQGLDRVEGLDYPHLAIAIVELGANDGLRGLPVENIRRNLAAIVSRFQSMGAEVILAGMEVPPNYGPKYADSFRNVFKSVAGETHAFLIPFFLEGVGGHRDLNQDDGIHPTAQGYDIVVENVWRVLEPLLQKTVARHTSHVPCRRVFDVRRATCGRGT